MKHEFTDIEHKQAFDEGWEVFFTGIQDATHNMYELQRVDEAKIFESDTEAQMHVMSLAENDTNSIHAKAIKFLAVHSPNEVDSILRDSSPVPFDSLLKKLNIQL